MSSSVIETSGGGHWGRLRSFLGREFREMLPPTLFFFVGFNLILFTKRLILEDYLVHYIGFFIATTSALVVGKSVLVANAMPFLRRFDDSPLFYPSCSKQSSTRCLFSSPAYSRRSFITWYWKELG